MPLISTFGAVVALVLAIVLIIRKVVPVYALMIGAVIGGLVGGGTLAQTVSLMRAGAQDIIPAVLRILSAGILAGALIESGAAEKIAETLVARIGESCSLFALALATMVLTMIGVFVDVAVITVASIALSLAAKIDLSRPSILIAMIGGGKAGNIMSPNPNTIAISENMNVPLLNLMLAGVSPALSALVVTCLLARYLKKKGSRVTEDSHEISASEKTGQDEKKSEKILFGTAIVGPLVAILLLALRPICQIAIDPLIALPVGGIAGLLAMGKIRILNRAMTTGLGKMGPVALLLTGTGCLAGIISESGLSSIEQLIAMLRLPGMLLAPVSGILIGGATASTTAGSAVASSVFGSTLLGFGLSGLAAGVMIHTGATVLDSLPHGSFFHATGGSVQMEMKERLRLIFFEAIIGITQTVLATVLFGLIL